MTFKDYTEKEKLAVIAVVKSIMLASRTIETYDEINYIREHITEENFPDYQEMFNKFEKLYPTENSMYEAFAEVENDKVKEQLIDLAINLAASAGVMYPKELEVINHMCSIWDMEHKAFTESENEE
jgi:hypothetical protein